MKNTHLSHLGRLAGRLVYTATRAPLVALALVALVSPASSSAQTSSTALPTQTLILLGGSGNAGAMAANVEYFNPAKNLWQPAYLADYAPYGHPVTHPWGNVPGTTRWINYRTDGSSDPGTAGGNLLWYDYRIRFTVPTDAIAPKMTFSLKADNYARVAINGVTAGGVTTNINGTNYNNVITGSTDQLNVDAVFAQAVVPGENTITLRIGDTGGLNGFNFKIEVSMQSSQPLQIVTPTPAINWVNWTGSEYVGGITKYVGTITVPRTGGGSTAVTVKYTPPGGIAFIQTTGSTDYFQQYRNGLKFRDPARSPYTSAKVPNIPDGGGGANDKGDIVAMQYAGTNRLEFISTSTGQPVAIASPVFAYVSLNGNGYGFNQDFDILSFGDGTVRDAGFWGSGTSIKNTTVVNGVTQYQLLQGPNPAYAGYPNTEPHGTLQFRGSFTSVSWQSLSNEYWNGFTIGVAQLAADVPIANAGLDQTVNATSASGASVQLQGSVSGSTNSPFTFTWTGPFGSASGATPTVTLPLGTNTLTLTVTDATGVSDSDTVVIIVQRPPDTTPPVISAPGDITREATSAAGAVVTFTATAVDERDGPVSVIASPVSGSTFPLGTSAVGLAASDVAGNTATASFDVTVQDTIAPVVAAPADITAEATSAAGAVVTYPAPTATDAVGVTSVTSAPASGSTFPLGTTLVTATAGDAAGNTGSGSFNVTVQDTIAPVVTAPANIVAEATSASGAAVSYPAATTTDAVGVTSLTYSAASGSTFPLGATTVIATVSDAAGNTSSDSFTVTVQDTTAPALTVPASQTLEAASAAGAVATFAASANDAVGVTSLTTSTASGSTFPIGTTTVTVTASDDAGNSSSGSFTVTVRDTTAPVVSVPADLTAEATSAAGAAVSYPAPTATDAVGVSSLSSSPASGSTFALGATTVTASASDAAGNTGSASFTVTVQDTTAPALTVPASQTLEATSAAGAVATFAASATDAVGVTSLTYSTASGSTFPLGTTTVTVTAKDAAGNSTTGSFTITVHDSTAPAFTGLTPSTATLWPPNHQMVAITLSAAVSDAVGVTSLKIIGVTSSEPDNGLGDGDTAGDIQVTGNLTLNLRAERAGKGNGRIYTITVEARDAAGNASTRITTVSVPKSMGK